MTDTRFKRWLRPIRRTVLLMPTVIVFTLAMAASWLLFSQAGLQRASSWVTWVSDDAVQIEGARGRLFGPLSVERLSIESAGNRYILDNLELAWNPMSLFDGLLEIHRLKRRPRRAVADRCRSGRTACCPAPAAGGAGGGAGNRHPRPARYRAARRSPGPRSAGRIFQRSHHASPRRAGRHPRRRRLDRAGHARRHRAFRTARRSAAGGQRHADAECDGEGRRHAGGDHPRRRRPGAKLFHRRAGQPAAICRPAAGGLAHDGARPRSARFCRDGTPRAACARCRSGAARRRRAGRPPARRQCRAGAAGPGRAAILACRNAPGSALGCQPAPPAPGRPVVESRR